MRPIAELAPGKKDGRVMEEVTAGRGEIPPGRYAKELK